MNEGGPKKRNQTGTIVERILRDNNSPDLLDSLTRLNRSDLSSVLIQLMEDQTEKISPRSLLNQYEKDRFTKPSPIDQRSFIVLDNVIAKTSSADIEFVELSPVAPLGANSALTPLSQKMMIPTIRGTEVMADTVTTLALEAATRRVSGATAPIYLCTSQREIRAQKYDPASGFLPHFRAVSLVSSESVDVRDEQQISEIIQKHLDFYLKILKDSSSEGLVEIPKITVRLSSLRILNALIKKMGISREQLTINTHNQSYDFFDANGITLPKRVAMGQAADGDETKKYQVTPIVTRLIRIGEPVFAKLAQEYPEVTFEFDLSRLAGIGYYEDLCFTINAQNSSGQEYMLASGGFTDWMQEMLGTPKEKCCAGGMGTELLIGQFGKKFTK